MTIDPILRDVLLRYVDAIEMHGDNHHSWSAWMLLLAEEVGEAAKEAAAIEFGGLTPDRLKALRNELIDVMQVAYATIKQIDDRLWDLALYDL